MSTNSCYPHTHNKEHIDHDNPFLCLFDVAEHVHCGGFVRWSTSCWGRNTWASLSEYSNTELKKVKENDLQHWQDNHHPAFQYPWFALVTSGSAKLERSEPITRPASDGNVSMLIVQLHQLRIKNVMDLTIFNKSHNPCPHHITGAAHARNTIAPAFYE